MDSFLVISTCPCWDYTYHLQSCVSVTAVFLPCFPSLHADGGFNYGNHFSHINISVVSYCSQDVLPAKIPVKSDCMDPESEGGGGVFSLMSELHFCHLDIYVSFVPEHEDEVIVYRHYSATSSNQVNADPCPCEPPSEGEMNIWRGKWVTSKKRGCPTKTLKIDPICIKFGMSL